MTDDNSEPENLVDTENLDKFEETFFQKDVPAKPERITEEKAPENKPEVPEEIEDDPLATEDDTDAPAETGDDEPEEEEDNDDEGETPEEAPPPKKGKKSFQERINELTAKAREAERRESDTLLRLREIEARSTPKAEPEPEPAPLREMLPTDAPSPDAVYQDGEPVYALGEFDPAYIRDLTKFTIVYETGVLRQQEAQQNQENQIAAAQQELTSAWAEKVQTIEQEIPEIRENIANLTETFQNIDPSYGEYLASTIMENEHGPEIMHYLSQNIGEAQAIVASGPRAATLALGRLEARLTKAEEQPEDTRDEKRVSNAPPPPNTGARGRGARTVVRADTDDLDAFERVFFKE